MGRRTNWGGSIATFIVVTVILLAGIVGVIYVLNRRGEQARNVNKGSISTTTSTEKQSGNNKSSSSGTKKESESSTSTSTSTSSQTSKSNPSELGATGYLPQTGPEDLFSNGLAVYALSASTIAYVVSRKKSSDSSLT